MSTEFNVAITTIFFPLGTLNTSYALDIVVPDASDVVEKSSAIDHLRLTVKNGEVMGKVLKKIQGCRRTKRGSD